MIFSPDVWIQGIPDIQHIKSTVYQPLRDRFAEQIWGENNKRSEDLQKATSFLSIEVAKNTILNHRILHTFLPPERLLVWIQVIPDIQHCKSSVYIPLRGSVP